MGEVTVDQLLEEKDGTVALVLRQVEPWDAPGVLSRLQGKINGYVSVICDGPLVEKFPEFRGKKCKVRLISHYDLPDDLRPKIDMVNQRLNQLGIGFVLMNIKIQPPHNADETLKEPAQSVPNEDLRLGFHRDDAQILARASETFH